MADLDQLKQKYSPVIQTIEGFSDLGAKVDSVDLDGDKLHLKGSVPSEVVANRVWDVIKQVDPTILRPAPRNRHHRRRESKLQREERRQSLQDKQPLLRIAQPLLQYCRREQYF